MATTFKKARKPPAEIQMKLHRAKTVANLLDCSVQQVYNLYNSGQLPGTRIGRSVRFPETLLLEFIQKRTTSVA